MNEKVGRLADETLNEIKNSNKAMKLSHSSYFEFPLEISHFHQDEMPNWFENVRETPLRVMQYFKNGYFKFCSPVTFSEEQYRNVLRNPDGTPIEEGKYPDEMLIEVYKEYVVSILNEHAFLFSLAANIARPGSLQFINRYSIQNNQLIRKDGGTINKLDTAVENCEKYSWPPIENLSVYDIWNWLCKVPGFRDGESHSKLGRAISAVTHLLNDNFADEDQMALVWALIGLEALYGTGNTGLKSQIMERTESFLGKRVSYKKDFSNMYDFRSRFVHGDRNFNYKGFERDSKISSDFVNDLERSEDVAIATLISTLQRMCIQNRYELNFSVVVKD